VAWRLYEIKQISAYSKCIKGTSTSTRTGCFFMVGVRNADLQRTRIRSVVCTYHNRFPVGSYFVQDQAPVVTLIRITHVAEKLPPTQGASPPPHSIKAHPPAVNGGSPLRNRSVIGSWRWGSYPGTGVSKHWHRLRFRVTPVVTVSV
jgi:hypothetical protein